MKKFFAVFGLIVGILFSACTGWTQGCNRTGMRLCTGSVTDTIYFYAAPSTTSTFRANHILFEFDSDATGTITIKRYVQVGTATDAPIYAIDDPSALTLVPGQRRTFSADGVVAFSYVMTNASDTLRYEANDCSNPSFEWISSENAVVDADWITITDGYHTAALSSYSFLPLQPVGEHNLIAFQISWATADTIWVQVLTSNSMMDSTTAFNFGTSVAPVYSKRLILASLTADTAPSGFTAGLTGRYDVLCPFSFLVQDEAGYPGLPQFAGIRVRANGEAITALRIVMGLATLNTCGGD